MGGNLAGPWVVSLLQVCLQHGTLEGWGSSCHVSHGPAKAPASGGQPRSPKTLMGTQ